MIKLTNFESENISLKTLCKPSTYWGLGLVSIFKILSKTESKSQTKGFEAN